MHWQPALALPLSLPAGAVTRDRQPAVGYHARCLGPVADTDGDLRSEVIMAEDHTGDAWGIAQISVGRGSDNSRAYFVDGATNGFHRSVPTGRTSGGDARAGRRRAGRVSPPRGGVAADGEEMLATHDTAGRLGRALRGFLGTLPV